MFNKFALVKLDLKTPYLLYHITKLCFVIRNHHKITESETVFFKLVKLFDTIYT